MGNRDTEACSTSGDEASSCERANRLYVTKMLLESNRGVMRVVMKGVCEGCDCLHLCSTNCGERNVSRNRMCLNHEKRLETVCLRHEMERRKRGIKETAFYLMVLCSLWKRIRTRSPLILVYVRNRVWINLVQEITNVVRCALLLLSSPSSHHRTAATVAIA